MAKRGSLGTEFVASAMMLVFGLFAPAVQPPEQGIEQTREDQVHVDIEKHRKPASGLTLSGNKRRFEGYPRWPSGLQRDPASSIAREARALKRVAQHLLPSVGFWQSADRLNFA